MRDNSRRNINAKGKRDGNRELFPKLSPWRVSARCFQGGSKRLPVRSFRHWCLGELIRGGKVTDE